MNERIKELLIKAIVTNYRGPMLGDVTTVDQEKFAELLIKECINTLEFHGFDDAIPYIQWMTTNRFGLKNES